MNILRLFPVLFINHFNILVRKRISSCKGMLCRVILLGICSAFPLTYIYAEAEEHEFSFSVSVNPSAPGVQPVQLSSDIQLSLLEKMDLFLQTKTLTETLSSVSANGNTEKSGFFLMHIQNIGIAITNTALDSGLETRDYKTSGGFTRLEGTYLPFIKFGIMQTKESPPFSFILQNQLRLTLPYTLELINQFTILEVINRDIGISSTFSFNLETLDSTFSYETLKQYPHISGSSNLLLQISFIEENTRHHFGFSLSFLQMGVIPRIHYSYSVKL